MKKLFVSLLIALTVGTTSVGFASQKQASSYTDIVPLQARVVVKPERLKLEVVVETIAHAVTIRLHNAQGQTLVKKQVGKNDQATLVRFDLAQLKDGDYSVEISDGLHKQVEAFNLQTSMPVPASYRTLSLQ